MVADDKVGLWHEEEKLRVLFSLKETRKKNKREKMEKNKIRNDNFRFL